MFAIVLENKIIDNVTYLRLGTRLELNSPKIASCEPFSMTRIRKCASYHGHKAKIRVSPFKAIFFDSLVPVFAFFNHN